jgi:hypothetical protein
MLTKIKEWLRELRVRCFGEKKMELPPEKKP